MDTPDAEHTVFQVHARSEGRDHSHRVEARSFEAAAVSFVERWRPAVDADDHVSILVADERGVEQCFTLDLGDGDIQPCG